MPSPEDLSEKLNRITTAWETFAPDRSFGGMTLQEFRDAIAPSFAARERIARSEAELAAARNARIESDHISANKAQLVVNSVTSDPEYGPDSDLYEAMGYARRRRRYDGPDLLSERSFLNARAASAARIMPERANEFSSKHGLVFRERVGCCRRHRRIPA